MKSNITNFLIFITSLIVVCFMATCVLFSVNYLNQKSTILNLETIINNQNDNMVNMAKNQKIFMNNQYIINQKLENINEETKMAAIKARIAAEQTSNLISKLKK